MPRTRWLSFHVGYTCRDSGACCAAEWPIPLEAGRAAAVADAIAAGAITAPATWLRRHDGQPDDVAGLIALAADRRCVFHRDPGCAIHATLGHGALPIACQYFPRRCLIDDRGVFVTLSHFCPTAARMLFDSRDAVTIVEGPPAIGGGGLPEGLDARGALPPLLTERVLMDLESYGAWERHMVRVLTAGSTAMAALDALERDATALARWRPGDSGPLMEAVLNLTEIPRGDAVDPWLEAPSIFQIARSSSVAAQPWPDMPNDAARIWRTRVAPVWDSMRSVVGRYLAAHAFANWFAYQGNGIHSVLRHLRLLHATLVVEAVRAAGESGGVLNVETLTDAFRQSDLLLVHLGDPTAVAEFVNG